MRISRPLAAFLGVVTVWPPIYMLLFMGFIASSFFLERGAKPDSTVRDLFGVVFVVHFATMLLLMALAVLYIVHLFKNEQLAGDRRILWALVLLLGGFIAAPIYWYFYIWRAATPRASIDNQPPPSAV